MFSGRVPDAFEPNALARLREEKLRAGASLIDLTESNPTRAGLAPSDAEIAAALAALPLGRYDPEPAGLAVAREAIAAHYAERGSLVAPERILLTASTSEAYAHLFRLLGEPGDEFLVPRPSYPLLEPLAALESVRLAPYALQYRGRWEIDPDEIAAAAGPRARAIIAVNPNNPTGSFASPAEAAAIEEICARSGIALIADEVFGDFAFDAAAPRRATFADAAAAPLTFVLSGLSKIAGLPQMKLGWILVAGPHAPAAMTRLEWIADAFLSVSTPVQRAAPRLLALAGPFQKGTRERTRANLAALARAVGARPELELLRVEGGWNAVIRVPRVRSEEEWALALLEQDVVVHPGHFYDFPDEAYLVVSLLPEKQTFAQGIARLVEIAGR